MALTASQLKSLHGKQQKRVIEKSDRDSLTIKVSKKGAISFYFRFRYKQKQQRMCLGQYPIMMLSEARTRVAEVKNNKCHK